MAETTLPGSRPNRTRTILIVVGLVILALLALIVLNINSIITGAGNVLTYVFSPNTRVNPNDIVLCKTNSGCSTIYSFVYSLLFLLILITGFAYTTLLERRFIAWFQHRVGPNRVGPKGLLQPLADAIKLITKEDIQPSGASKAVWFIAPVVKAVPILITLAVVPLGPDLLIPWFDGKWYQVSLALADVNVGVLWILAVTSVGTYGIVLAGWASNNKYAMLGGLRSSAQMISYELSLGLTMGVPILIVGSMSIGDIIQAQPMIWNWFVFQNPLACAILMIALLAEISRAPFDLPEAEQELTAGFMTEYSAMKFALFMMAEYLGMIVVSIVVVSLFFGGYQDGFGLVNSVPILGPLVLILKILPFLIGMVWVRATLPRIRYDRLMHFGWKVLLPLAILSIMWTAIAVTIGDVFQSTIVYGIVSGIVFVVVLAGGLYLLSRAGRTQVVEEEKLEDDPMVTGERRGLGWAAINVIGAIVAIPFALIGFVVSILRGLGGDEAEETALATSDQSKAPSARAKQPGGD